MTAKAIQYYLSQDVTDADPSVVSADNPTLWPTASDVPDYAFESLGTIWLGAPSTSADLINNITYEFGTNTGTTTEIALFTKPVESVLFDKIKDNTIGAEESNLVIRLFRSQKATSTVGLMQNAELRLRYLLDMSWRRLRRGVTPYVPATGDNSVNPNTGIICSWDGFITPPSANEIQVRYRIYFVRAVPRVTNS